MRCTPLLVEALQKPERRFVMASLFPSSPVISTLIFEEAAIWYRASVGYVRLNRRRERDFDFLAGDEKQIWSFAEDW